MKQKHTKYTKKEKELVSNLYHHRILQTMVKYAVIKIVTTEGKHRSCHTELITTHSFTLPSRLSNDLLHVNCYVKHY